MSDADGEYGQRLAKCGAQLIAADKAYKRASDRHSQAVDRVAKAMDDAELDHMVVDGYLIDRGCCDIVPVEVVNK